MDTIPDQTSMDTIPDRERVHVRLLQQLKGASIPFSLTILSIIQGVALAALAAVVAAGYRDFSLVTWVLALTTLAMIGVVYFHIGIDIIGWVWIPTMSDAVVPFLLGAEELFLSYTITGPLGVWLLGFVAILVSSVLGHARVLRKARAEWDNAPLLPYLEHHRRFALRLTAAGAALLLALALGSLAAGLGGREPVQGHAGLAGLVIGLLALGWLGGYAYRLTRHWESVIRFARTGRLPDAYGLSPQPRGRRRAGGWPIAAPILCCVWRRVRRLPHPQIRHDCGDRLQGALGGRRSGGGRTASTSTGWRTERPPDQHTCVSSGTRMAHVTLPAWGIVSRPIPVDVIR